ncbi:hypothetical protein BTO16_11660 [Polaribacter glomeratus]|uniref:Uncharacterized protein n=1 Tax=Polaribacter glomeratus TaxID=102 RepID=A0A2S7WG15_9FLAO|nr:hypothetical protein BTO16_11660 [Polaribacter glomeratus]
MKNKNTDTQLSLTFPKVTYQNKNVFSQKTCDVIKLYGDNNSNKNKSNYINLVLKRTKSF